MSVALAPWPKEALAWASYELRLPIFGDSLTRRGETRPGEDWPEDWMTWLMFFNHLVSGLRETWSREYFLKI